MNQSNIENSRFILSLSAADFSLSVFVMSPYVLNHREWIWGLLLCKIWGTADVLFASASVYNVVAVSIDRFYAVFFPIRYMISFGIFTSLISHFVFKVSLKNHFLYGCNTPETERWNDNTLYHKLEWAKHFLFLVWSILYFLVTRCGILLISICSLESPGSWPLQSHFRCTSTTSGGVVGAVVLKELALHAPQLMTLLLLDTACTLPFLVSSSLLWSSLFWTLGLS